MGTGWRLAPVLATISVLLVIWGRIGASITSRTERSMAGGLLSGVRVVEGSAFVAAPSGGMTLAQLGADVIRFDQIGGGLDYRRWPLSADGTSIYWAGLNKGKRSLAVDLRSPRGRELLTELIGAPGPDNGIFLTNFPASGWMSYERLRDKRADLVMLNVMGNHDGTSAVDYTVNCAVGYPSVTGPADSTEPVNHVFPAWDFLCGQQVALGIVAALRHRDRTGDGQLVTLALSDVALWAVSAMGHIAEAQVNGSERPRIGNDLYGAFGCDFATGDGRRVIAVAVTYSQWKSLLDATGLADEVQAIGSRRGLDFRIEGDRYLAREELDPLVATWCAARSFDEIRTAFDAHGVCLGAVPIVPATRERRPAMFHRQPVVLHGRSAGDRHHPGCRASARPCTARAHRRGARAGARPAHRRDPRGHLGSIGERDRCVARRWSRRLTDAQVAGRMR